VSSPIPHCFAKVAASMLGFLADDRAEQMVKDNSCGSGYDTIRSDDIV
jgi:hypothetical protein